MFNYVWAGSIMFTSCLSVCVCMCTFMWAEAFFNQLAVDSLSMISF